MKGYILKLARTCVANLALVGGSLLVTELALRCLGFSPWNNRHTDTVITEFDPEVGWRMIPATFDLQAGKQRYQITTLPDFTRSLGDISPTSFGAPKTTLILGDSCMWGWGLNDNQTLAANLAKRFPRERFVNAAVPGYGLTQSILRFRQLTRQMPASLIIIGVADYLAERDHAALSWAQNLAEHSPLSNTILPYARLNAGKLEIVGAQPIFPELPLRDAFAIVKVLETMTVIPSAMARESSAWEIEKALFEMLASEAKKTGTRVLLFGWRKGQNIEQFVPLWKDLGLTYLDCTSPDTDTPTGQILGDIHPNERVTSYWAGCLAGELSKQYGGKDR